MAALFNVKNPNANDLVLVRHETAETASPPTSPLAPSAEASSTSSATTGHEDHGAISLPLYQAPWYNIPSALFLWGESPPHIHGDSSSLFFDLIYVGVTFNIGNLLVNSLSVGSVATYAVLFMIMFDSWMKRLYMDSTLLTNDKVHRLGKLLQGLLTAISAFNLTPATINISENNQMIALVVAKCLHTLVVVLVWVELWKYGATAAERGMGRRISMSTIAGFAVQVVVLLVLLLAPDNGEATGAAGDGYHRLLADKVYVTYSPKSTAVLVLLGLSYTVERLINNIQIFFTNLDETNTIPLHVGYILHRFGEFNILMLGEGVLQIILQTMDLSAKYHMLFAGAYLLMALLQLIHYSSMPFAVRDHAISKSRRRGTVWIELLVVYSAAQVGVGVALKVILKYFRYQLEAQEPHRVLASADDLPDPTPYMWLLSFSIGTILSLLIVQQGLHIGFLVLAGIEDDDDGENTGKKESPLRRKKRQLGVTLKLILAGCATITPLWVSNAKYKSAASVYVTLIILSLTFVAQVMQGAFDRERKLRKTLKVLMFVSKLKSGVAKTRKATEQSDSVSFKDMDVNGTRRSSVPFVSRRDDKASEHCLHTIHLDIVRFIRRVKLYDRPRYLFELDSNVDREVAWADLFFDLIYVAVLFKLGELLVLREYGFMVVFVYAMIFFSLFECWEEKNEFDSRFANKDVFHKFLDMLQGLCIAFAASFIVSETEYVGHTITGDFSFDSRGVTLTLAYTTALLAYRAMRLFTLLELRWTTEIPAVKAYVGHSLFLLLLRTIPLVADVIYVLSTDEPHVLPSVGLWGLTLVLSKVAALGHAVATRLGRAKELGYHQGYLLHRYGEWMMLVLGEGVMQIIITEPLVSAKVLVTFSLAYLVLTAVRLIHYQIEADNPESHAFRDGLRGWYWSLTMIGESLAVIAFGVFLSRLVADSATAHTDEEAWGMFIEELYGIISWVSVITIMALMASELTHYGHRTDLTNPTSVLLCLLPVGFAAVPLAFAHLRWSPPAFATVVVTSLWLCMVALAKLQRHRETKVATDGHRHHVHNQSDDTGFATPQEVVETGESVAKEEPKTSQVFPTNATEHMSPVDIFQESDNNSIDGDSTVSVNLTTDQVAIV